jgi:hypothetical protein
VGSRVVRRRRAGIFLDRAFLGDVDVDEHDRVELCVEYELDIDIDAKVPVLSRSPRFRLVCIQRHIVRRIDRTPFMFVYRVSKVVQDGKIYNQIE